MGDEERVGRDLSAPARPLGDDRAAERRQAERNLGRAVGVRDAASDGAAVARDEMADVRERLAEEGMRARIPFQRGLAHRGADPDDSVASIRSSPARLRSTRSVGRTRRMLSAGTRLWPPAIGFASSSRASASSASSSEWAAT